jgi:hypothetical protein
MFCGAAHAQVRITQPAQLGASVVTTPAIANGSVTAEKLAAGAAPGFVWGSATGTLANQTDLWAVLNGKAPLVAGVVPVANLGSGTPSTSTYLRGDGAWTAPPFVTVPSTSAFLIGNGSGGVSAGTTTGLLKASSGVVSAAVAGTDYVVPSGNITGTAAGLSTTLAVGSGGTGATSASGARAALGLSIGTDVLAPTGSGAGLSGVALLGSANTFAGTQSVTGGVAATGTVSGATATGTATTSAVVGSATGSGTGVYGITSTGIGVQGRAGGTGGFGVSGLVASVDGTAVGASQFGSAGGAVTNPLVNIARTIAAPINTSITGDLIFGNDAGVVSGTGVRSGNLLRLQNAGTNALTVDLSGNLTATGRGSFTGLRLVSPTVPATASSSGTAGDMAWDSGFVYVCTATNTWKRAALSTW